MNIAFRLNEIWNKEYIQYLPFSISERGYMYSINIQEKDILITGINPSFRKEDGLENHTINFQEILANQKWDNYWGFIKKMLYSTDGDIDLRNKSAYLDIFYFREKEQKFLQKKILTSEKGLSFVSDQIRLTQRIIEEIIKPKVIILKNMESSAYWGFMSDKGIFWMGYKFQYLESLNCGELFKIIGFVDTNQRIIPEIQVSNNKGTYVLLTQHINQYVKKEKRPTPEIIQHLLFEFTNDKL